MDKLKIDKVKLAYRDIASDKPQNKLLQSIQSWSLFPWLVWILGLLFYCYEYLLRTMPGVMKPELTATFHLTQAQFGNFAGFYLYSYVPMQVLVGVLMDRLAPRMLLSFAISCCVLGSVLFAATDILLVGQIGRLLIGFGSAFAYVGALKLASVWLPPNRFALLVGITAGLGPLGALVGNNFLNWLTVHLDWQTVVFYFSGFGILLTYLIWFFVRDAKGRGRAQLRYQERSMRDLFADIWEVLKHRQIWLNGMFACFGYMTLDLIADTWGTGYLHEGLGLNQTDAVFFNSLLYLGFVCGGPCFGWWSDHIKRRLLPMGVGAFCAAMSIFLLLYLPFHARWILTAILIMVGFFSGAQALTFAVAKESAAPQITGSVVAITNLFTMLGGAILTPVFGAILEYEHLVPAQFGTAIAQADYRAAFVILPIGLLVSVITIACMKETRASHIVEHKA